jgi:hypothetical protein
MIKINPIDQVNKIIQKNSKKKKVLKILLIFFIIIINFSKVLIKLNIMFYLF